MRKKKNKMILKYNYNGKERCVEVLNPINITTPGMQIDPLWIEIQLAHGCKDFKRIKC